MAARENVDGATVPPVPQQLRTLACEAVALARCAEAAGPAAHGEEGGSDNGAEQQQQEEHEEGSENGDHGGEGGVSDDAGFSPDIAIVNLYSKAGSLGLHQDRHESEESLSSGTPVVSISLADSCVFVLGPPTREVGGTPPSPAECQYVRLYSGDVLVFGGPSRLSYHGVKSVLTNTAPKQLSLPERPCRLNVTLRRF